jgi:hypothetical protein
VDLVKRHTPACFRESPYCWCPAERGAVGVDVFKGDPSGLVRRLLMRVGSELIFPPSPEHQAYLDAKMEEELRSAREWALQHGAVEEHPPNLGPYREIHRR